jgi:RNA polymerase sigma-70 factor (ECF subfamily)
MNAPSSPNEESARVRTRASLLARLKDLEDSRSWREFFDTYWRVIYRFALRCGAAEAEAEDAVQETVIVVAKKIGGFAYDPKAGRFSSWLYAITQRQVRKLQARRLQTSGGAGPAEADEEGESWLDRVPDPASLQPDAVWEEEWRRNILAVATERAKRRVNRADYQRYEYWILQGHSVAETAADLDCAENTVYSARHRVEAAIKEEAEKLRLKSA